MSDSSGQRRQWNQPPWENIQMWMSYKCHLHLQREKSSRFSQKHWCSHIFISDSTIIITKCNINIFPGIVVVQLCSYVCLTVAPRTAACQASFSFIISQNLLKLMSIESVMPSNHFFFCHPLLLRPWIFPSIRIFSNELALICMCILQSTNSLILLLFSDF